MAKAFSPLFIGAQVSTSWIALLSFLLIAELSVPSSSGHRFQQDLAIAGGSWYHRTFSPLFIGAQVSTLHHASLHVDGDLLSVPSSSGHRFQRIDQFLARESICASFSPLFIGAQVSTCPASAAEEQVRGFQFPLYRGTGFNSSAAWLWAASLRLSVPSSSGHRFQHFAIQLLSLPPPRCFQSPLHRGTGFNLHGSNGGFRWPDFQSPLHRGTGFNPLWGSWTSAYGPLSVPSSSGHRFQRNQQSYSPHFIQHLSVPLHRGTGFNQAHTGASLNPMALSVPSSSGHRFQHFHGFCGCGGGANFQSPLHRGTGFNVQKLLERLFLGSAFSPLFIGAQVSTKSGRLPLAALRTVFQSPLHRGTGFNRFSELRGQLL